MALENIRLYGKDRVFAHVNRAIADGDGMAKGRDLDYYFSVGACALSLITETLSTASVAPTRVLRVLDYACGYGRVLRWLQAEFPEAWLLGVDADEKAAQAAGRTLGVETRPLDLSLSDPIDAPFDLIWVGSLFTHLPEAETLRVLRYLRAHLTPSGVLVYTMHGHLIRDRLQSRERLYGLAEDAADRVVTEFDTASYGFADYPRLTGYGVSAATPTKMMEMNYSAGLRPVLFKARGWVQHQDVYGCTA